MELYRARLLSNDTPNNRNGHRHLRATLGTLASFIVILLASSSASAATLNVVGGQLLGASDVIVGGSLYKVEFLDGTCIDLFNGCDDVSDFTFQTEADAVLASQALLDQVFLDGANLFDSDPALTNGCEGDTPCVLYTPFRRDDSLGRFNLPSGRAVNTDQGSSNFVDARAGEADFETQGNPAVAFAVWSPVPEPGTSLLMGLGLLGLSASKCREGGI